MSEQTVVDTRIQSIFGTRRRNRAAHQVPPPKERPTSARKRRKAGRDRFNKRSIVDVN